MRKAYQTRRRTSPIPVESSASACETTDVIKYLGSKRRLVPLLLDVVRSRAPDATSVLDLFSGTARVGMAMKGAGLRVLANDHNAYAHALARCYVEADADRLPEIERLLDELRALPPKAGWFTKTFCEDARFFHPKNGARIDAMRDHIARLSLDPVVKSVLLVALMEAADRVDSTVGVQMAYLKSWAPRALHDLELRAPALLPRAAGGAGEAWMLDAAEAAGRLEADVAYLDPPYNQHSYLRNYHIWESLVLWDRPEVFGRAMKRVDCRERSSAFNLKRSALPALSAVIDAVRAKLLVVSFNDEGFIDRATLEELLSRRGPVEVLEVPYRRYVGAKIGIYNPSGEKVGAVSHLENKELVFVVRCDAAPRAGVDAAGDARTKRAVAEDGVRH
jgi:adenine-specific DNA-methyltransferase